MHDLQPGEDVSLVDSEDADRRWTVAPIFSEQRHKPDSIWSSSGPRSARLGPEEMALGEIWDNDGVIATLFKVRRDVEPAVAKSRLRHCLEELITRPARPRSEGDPMELPLVR